MRVHFSTDDLQPRDREEFWLEFVSKHVLSVTPGERSDPATFRAQLSALTAGRFTMFDLQTSHRINGRTPADVSRDHLDKFNLRRVSTEQIYRVSPAPGRTEEIRLSPGDFCVTSVGWPNQSTMTEGVSFSALLIPREMLSPLLTGGHLTRPIPVRAGTPIGFLLGSAFEAAAAQVPLLAPELADAVLQTLSGLVALACGASEEGRFGGREALRAARLEAAKRHIERRLAEPDLTPGSAAAALGISLRQLHLLFEPTGTSFAQYVARRRLERCRAALIGPAGVRRSVADIAFGWGFNSLATFYRAFERNLVCRPPFCGTWRQRATPNNPRAARLLFCTH
jgi:AraC-like DNA-binding protein